MGKRQKRTYDKRRSYARSRNTSLRSSRKRRRKRKRHAIAEYGELGYRQCAKKHCYCHDIAVTLAELQSRATGKRISVYQCPICGGWHLTHRNSCENGVKYGVDNTKLDVGVT